MWSLDLETPHDPGIPILLVDDCPVMVNFGGDCQCQSGGCGDSANKMARSMWDNNGHGDQDMLMNASNRDA